MADKVSVILALRSATCLAMAPLVTSVRFSIASRRQSIKSRQFHVHEQRLDERLCDRFYRYFKTQNWKRIALITSTDASGQDADEGFEAALNLPEFKTSGLSLVSHEHFNVTISA